MTALRGNQLCNVNAVANTACTASYAVPARESQVERTSYPRPLFPAFESAQLISAEYVPPFRALCFHHISLLSERMLAWS